MIEEIFPYCPNNPNSKIHVPKYGQIIFHQNWFELIGGCQKLSEVLKNKVCQNNDNKKVSLVKVLLLVLYSSMKIF